MQRRGAFVRKIQAACLLVAFVVVPAQAADSSSSVNTEQLDARSAVGIILASGLVGGLLGLSTLSFYSRPEENIRNITIGAGAGVVASAIYVTILMSTSSHGNEEKGKNASVSGSYVLPLVAWDSVGVAAGLRF